MIPRDLREAVTAHIDEQTTSQILRVSVDHLDSWHVPGAIFIGDAAHTMSPMAGQGLNAALRDSVVLANHVIVAVNNGQPIDDALLAAVERERRPEIDALQEAGKRVNRIVSVPLPVMHLMFTVLGLVTKVAAPASPADNAPDVRMRYPVPISSGRNRIG
jgi:2-polyprenyl-6-methoxyphenol hydroxylase-like FAD-dependent oxidoreductase